MPRTNFNMTEEDLLGYPMSVVGCKNCSDMCCYKTARLYEGRPVVFCGNRPEGIEVLKHYAPQRD